MTITLYHNPRCSKSRDALALLREHDIEPVIKLYIDNPPDANELRALLKKLQIPARELLRSGEAVYKELGLNNPSLTDDQLIEHMIAHPRLIERPIAIEGRRAVIGRPPENVLSLLD